MSWIDVSRLEGSKEQFDWSCIVGVRSSEENGYLEASHQVQCTFRSVIWGVVDQDHCVGAPLSIFSIKFQDELPQEDLHHPVVGVGLQQRQEDLSICVQANEHGDPWNHRQLRK